MTPGSEWDFWLLTRSSLLTPCWEVQGLLLSLWPQLVLQRGERASLLPGGGWGKSSLCLWHCLRHQPRGGRLGFFQYPGMGKSLGNSLSLCWCGSGLDHSFFVVFGWSRVVLDEKVF